MRGAEQFPNNKRKADAIVEINNLVKQLVENDYQNQKRPHRQTSVDILLQTKHTQLTDCANDFTTFLFCQTAFDGFLFCFEHRPSGTNGQSQFTTLPLLTPTSA